MNNIIRISAGIRGKDIVLFVAGKANWKISDAIKKFEVDYSLLFNGSSNLIFDLTECTAIDSTAIGLVCHLAVRFYKSTGNRAVAWIEQERVWGVFELMNCDRIMNMQPPPESNDRILQNDLKEYKIEDTDEQSLRETMLTAHTALSELNSENEAQFADVIEDLKRVKKDG